MAIAQIVPVVPGGDLRISATAYVAFRQCPERANVRFQGRYGVATRASFTGSLAHQMFKRHLTSGPIDETSFGQVCREEIGNTSRLNNTLGELRLKPSEVAGIVEEVRALYERFVRFPQDGFSGAEVAFEIAAADGLELVGQVDAVFDEGSVGSRLVDWKTGALGDSEDQLLFYALLWALDREELPAMLEAISVKTGERFTRTPAVSDIKTIAEEVGSIVDALRTAWTSGEKLERRGGPWCRHCPVLDDCEEGAATVSVLGNN